MKKKTWMIGLAGAVILAAAAGSCSSGSTETKSVTAATTAAAAESEAGSGAESAAAGDTNSSETAETSAENAKSDGTVSIEPQVLLDQNDVVITAQEYVTDSIWGDGIKVLIENNGSQDVGISTNELIVNDYMISGLFSSTVAAGKKANDVVYLSSSELEAAGIDTVGKIEIYFHAFDSNSYQTLWDADGVEIRTSAYDSMDTTPNDAGVELYNQDGIRIVGKTVDENSFWGTAILLYVENTTERNVGVSVDDMSVNGFMMNPFFATTVYAGKKAIDDITLLSSDLEANGIESIETVELKFHIYDADTYETITDSDPITFAAE